MTARVRERHRDAAGRFVYGQPWGADPFFKDPPETARTLAALLAETEAAALKRAALEMERNISVAGPLSAAKAIRALIEADE